MTAADPTIPAKQAKPLAAATTSGWWDRVEATLERAGERLNPILVKETRQALKSRQFVITFTLVLIFGWGWSLLGTAIQSPMIYYSPRGMEMLIGYYVVLAFPLLLVVPFSAFRSLASEREDGTFELLSITALSARQIVTGKLGSALLQMLVYYSALAPCVAFTYLLRGVDIFTIALLLTYTFMTSLILSTVGLMLATVTQSRHWQVFLSVVFLAGLLIGGFILSYTTIAILVFQPLRFDSADFWIGNLALLSGYVSYMFLFIFAASAQLSFASDNRATPLRVLLLVQQVLLVGWIVYFWTVYPDDEAFILLTILAAIHWFVAGSLMCGETAKLSPRVRRSLPQSFLGRTLLTWFNPGSGTGYTFAVANLFSVVALVCIIGWTSQILGFAGAPKGGDEWFWFSLLAFGYVTGYLGVGRLMHLAARQFVFAGLAVSFLFQILLAALGAVGPWFLQLYLSEFRDTDYSEFQFTNWFWTLAEVADSRVPTAVVVLVLGGAAVIFLLNLWLTSREVENVRLETPQRVIEDELLMHPENAIAAVPASPWDD